MRLIECVPNFSVGRDLQTVHRIRTAIAESPGARVLDHSSDASHNRSVITFMAPPDCVGEAAFNSIAAARDLIDMRSHLGVHPRIGAADVVPFVPLGNVTMEECAAVAREVGERVGRELEIPVYLYGEAATRPERRQLVNVRRGQLEGLTTLIGTDPMRAPDYGPRRMHSTFGAVAIGARKILVAFNVYIGDTSAMPVAREVAKAVRESSGGLPGVRALALEVDGQAQVSMNLVDLEQTSVREAFAAVAREAGQRGAQVTWSELIGLMPESQAIASAAGSLEMRDFHAGRVLDRRVREESVNAAVSRLMAQLDREKAPAMSAELLRAVADLVEAGGNGDAAARLRAHPASNASAMPHERSE